MKFILSNRCIDLLQMLLSMRIILPGNKIWIVQSIDIYIRCFVWWKKKPLLFFFILFLLQKFGNFKLSFKLTKDLFALMWHAATVCPWSAILGNKTCSDCLTMVCHFRRQDMHWLSARGLPFWEATQMSAHALKAHAIKHRINSCCK